ncbi:hypothetical protein YC2023_059611 [Brassica napus]
MIKNLHGVTLKALPGIISLSTFDNGNLSGKLSFIKLTRKQSINWGGTSTLINYTRKLANVTVLSHLDDIYYVFDLWVLEDANEHRWSMRQCSFLRSWWNSFGNIPISFQGTNRIGEIIIAPKFFAMGPSTFLHSLLQSKLIKPTEVSPLSLARTVRVWVKGRTHTLVVT